MQPVNGIAKILATAGHEVTRIAVRHDLRWLPRARRMELVFNLCEGINGVSRYEDMVAATLELAAIPSTGCTAWTIALCHNKPVVNAVLQAAGLPVPRWVVPRGHRVARDFPLPAIVKPAAEDASVGIDQSAVVTTRSALESRIARLTETFDEVLVQEYVAGREFAVGFVGDKPLPVSEIDYSRMPEGAWPILSFDAKWKVGSPEDLGSRPTCPAVVDRELERRIVSVAQSAWRAVDGRGYGRIDLRLDPAGQPWIIEVNPNPDISDDAGLSRMAEVRGWSYDTLVLRIAESALQAAQRTESVEQLAGTAAAQPAGRASRQTPA